MIMDDIVPATETIAVAAAATNWSCEVITTFFWGISLVPSCKYSSALSKNVLTLSTKIWVDATETFWIIFDVGVISGS